MSKLNVGLFVLRESLFVYKFDALFMILTEFLAVPEEMIDDFLLFEPYEFYDISLIMVA